MLTAHSMSVYALKDFIALERELARLHEMMVKVNTSGVDERLGEELTSAMNDCSRLRTALDFSKNLANVFETLVATKETQIDDVVAAAADAYVALEKLFRDLRTLSDVLVTVDSKVFNIRCQSQASMEFLISFGASADTVSSHKAKLKRAQQLEKEIGDLPEQLHDVLSLPSPQSAIMGAMEIAMKEANVKDISRASNDTIEAAKARHRAVACGKECVLESV